ncbi:hypothetical protein FACS189427_05160 [Planctomycetales bacterium]|nr:hypothetical protein FACS189427_05160 [Planctomycetales bacterium]
MRRFHDKGTNGLSGVLLFGASWFFGIITIFSIPMDNPTDLSNEAVTCSALQIGLQIIVFIIACFDSQPGPNEYGPNPKGQ